MTTVRFLSLLLLGVLPASTAFAGDLEWTATLGSLAAVLLEGSLSWGIRKQLK